MGLSAMWLDKGRITRDYVDGYRCAQLAHGWETGLLHFLEARLAGLWLAQGRFPGWCSWLLGFRMTAHMLTLLFMVF